MAGTDTYILGSPRFPRVTLRPFQGDTKIELLAHGANAKNIYVAGCTWESVNLTAPVLSHVLLAKGGTLECWMTGDATQAAWVDPKALF